MAAKTIDTIVFDIMQGRPERPSERVRTTERTGVDGSEIRLEGQREIAVPILTTKTYADAAAADAAETAYKALEGTIVEVIDAHNITHANCLIVTVRPTIRAVINPTPNVAHTRQVIATWIVRKLSA